MEYWAHVAQVPHDSDATYLEGSYAGAAFNVGVADVALAPGERIVAATGALCWRNAASGSGRAVLRVKSAELATANFTPGPVYDTVFVFSRLSPATGKPWTKADVDVALVGAVVYSGSGLRATQAGVHVLLHTPPVVPLKAKEWPMNFKALEPLTATGSDQAVEVPRGATLIVRPLAASVEVRDVAGGTAKLTIPADESRGRDSVTRGVSVADLDGDGGPDLAYVNEKGLFRVLRGRDGEGLDELDTAQLVAQPVAASSHGPAIADLDGDGRLDVFFVVGGTAEGLRHGTALCVTGFPGRGPGWCMFRSDQRNTGNVAPPLDPALSRNLREPRRN